MDNKRFRRQSGGYGEDFGELELEELDLGLDDEGGREPDRRLFGSADEPGASRGAPAGRGAGNARRTAIIAACAAAAVLVAAGGAYFGVARKYQNVFFPKTTINGIDASGKTVEEVKELISAGISEYELTVTQRGKEAGSQYEDTISKEDIGLHSVFDGSLEKLLEAQEPGEWLIHLFQADNHEIETMIAYDEDAYDRAVFGLSGFEEANVVKPQDARLSDYVAGKGYSIIPEVEGNEADRELVAAAISEAILNLHPSLSLEEAGCYRAPKVKKDDEKLTRLAEKLNRLAGVTVTYDFGSKGEVLDGDTIHKWLTVTGDGDVAVSSEGVLTYVRELASKYDTYNKAKYLKTTYGETVRIAGGTYGWKINQDAEARELADIILSGQSQTREPVYTQRAASHGENDYGDTYVEINLTAQHMYFYKDGKLLAEADFVSGNLSKGYGTPAGSFPLTYKQRNATLKGEDYRTPVSYWMPFNGNIGLHDADWRSSFGGSIYKTGGSHGCVNLPPDVAKKVYENIEQGDPVLCYNLPGTERTASSAADGRTPETTKAPETAKAPEETGLIEPTKAPPETTAPNSTTAPDSQTGAVVTPAETAPAPEQPADTPNSTESPAPSKSPAGPGAHTDSTESVPGKAGPGSGI